MLTTSLYMPAQGYYAVADDRCGYNWDLVTDKNWERGRPFNYFTQGMYIYIYIYIIYINIYIYV
jgi:hypothetical protein